MSKGSWARYEVGQRIGMLILLEPTRMPSGRKAWVCQCDCGRTKIVATTNLGSKGPRSCGCRRGPRIHGWTSRDATFGQKATFYTWKSMIQRCDNPKHTMYEYYGGRGVKVCDRWRDFMMFVEDMGERPEDLTLDRLDSTKDYEPGNCRWADQETQSMNKKSSHLLTINGETKTIHVWAKENNIHPSTIKRRIRLGEDVESAVKRPAALTGRNAQYADIWKWVGHDAI